MDISEQSEDAPTTQPRRILIAMDCLCDYHGGYLSHRALDIPDIAVVHVLSSYLSSYLQVTGAADDEDLQARQRPLTETEASSFLASIGGENVEVVAVYCESDAGLQDAEELRALLLGSSYWQDAPIVEPARRDKNLMYSKVAQAGLHVAKSQLCDSLEQAMEFAETQLSRKRTNTDRPMVVVKPFRGVASESVALCTSREEVEAAWNTITSSQVYGSKERHSNVLVQEFLDGIEYALDVVSRNGEHKVMAVWRYVKKPANGAPFCYYKTELVDSTMDSNVEAICEYTLNVLNALGIRWGISHNEVIVQSNGSGPALVEVNTRQHNMNFLPLVMSCIGYNIFDIYLLALFFGDDEWSSIPNIPTLRAFGCMAHLVNSRSGVLARTHHIEEMANLPSVFESEIYENFRSPGQEIAPTVDIRTDAGWAQLINPDRQELDRDYNQIEKWMDTMFETTSTNDPEST